MPWLDPVLPSPMESHHLARGQGDFHKNSQTGTKPGPPFQSSRRQATGTAAWGSTHTLSEFLVLLPCGSGVVLVDGFWTPLHGRAHLIAN